MNNLVRRASPLDQMGGIQSGTKLVPGLKSSINELKDDAHMYCIWLQYCLYQEDP